MRKRNRQVLPNIEEIAKQARQVYDKAVESLGPELCGYSALDLLADNLPYDLDTLHLAIAVANIPYNPDAWKEVGDA